MKIERFDMERTQCLYENEVRYNLSESGVLPMSIEEVCVDAIDPASLHGLRLKYPHANGSPELRGHRVRPTSPGRRHQRRHDTRPQKDASGRHERCRIRRGDVEEETGQDSRGGQRDRHSGQGPHHDRDHSHPDHLP